MKGGNYSASDGLNTYLSVEDRVEVVPQSSEFVGGQLNAQLPNPLGDLRGIHLIYIEKYMYVKRKEEE